MCVSSATGIRINVDFRPPTPGPQEKILSNFFGTKSDDDLLGTPQNDSFDLSQGGSDQADGSAGNDVFQMGPAFDAYDRLAGGSGQDVVQLDGNYPTLVLRVHSLSDIEAIGFGAGHDYVIRTNDANVAARRTLLVDGSHLNPGDLLTFNGSAESNGEFVFVGGRGQNTFVGGDGRDIFKLGSTLDASDRINGGGGSDHLVIDGNYSGARALGLSRNSVDSVAIFAVRAGHNYDITADAGAFGRNHELINIVSYTFGKNDALTFDGSAEPKLPYRFLPNNGTYHLSSGAANDSFCFGEHFNSHDTIDGGGGSDALVLNGSFQHPELNGNYTGPNALSFGGHQLASVETLALIGGYSYRIKMADGNIKPGHTLVVQTNGFKTAGSGAESGNLTALGGSDTLQFDGRNESHGHFVFEISSGHNVLSGGALSDTFSYSSKFPASVYDTISFFDFSNDRIRTNAIAGVGGNVHKGSLSADDFGADLMAAIGPGDLASHHAVLFRPVEGGLAHDWFLIVDENGKAGFQAGKDLAIELKHPLHVSEIGMQNFVS
jgi:hypothetical protein